eukprot:CAMPEP_0197851368 /NCGR_PEP_ID=MMETSP1438-20131217/17903_1 /TAXON_ID=1461541 /ORGANISM="Pterosperma sp., Strain CCMP1384" /LENGTH=532 /DNA_ID=CAMNT_0043464949 /DNA_START=219 /DNA_END=1817 /DNA_ORIENTATION=+
MYSSSSSDEEEVALTKQKGEETSTNAESSSSTNLTVNTEAPSGGLSNERQWGTSEWSASLSQGFLSSPHKYDLSSTADFDAALAELSIAEREPEPKSQSDDTAASTAPESSSTAVSKTEDDDSLDDQAPWTATVSQLPTTNIIDLEPPAAEPEVQLPREVGRAQTTAVVYDNSMTRHEDAGSHPECPERIVEIQKRLKKDGLLSSEKCAIVESKVATMEQLQLVHTERHCEITTEFGDYSNKELRFMAKRYNSVYLNEHSTDCALLAAGSVVNVVEQVVTGVSQNGACVVRPPGHHAEAARCMGFCILNNIAIAAALARKQYGVNKVLVLDWDVHHGNGTQEIFECDPNVLFMSIHRFDQGRFYPGGPAAKYDAVGKGEGKGYNVNIGWNVNDDSSDDEDDAVDIVDADYYHAFQHVIMPIARQFEPELVLVSAGFDAAEGDPLGGCHLSPRCFAKMTEDLKSLAGGRMVLVLEGGYNLEATASSFAECVKVLQGEECPPWDDVVEDDASSRAKFEVQNTRKAHAKYWECLA